MGEEIKSYQRTVPSRVVLTGEFDPDLQGTNCFRGTFKRGKVSIDFLVNY